MTDRFARVPAGAGVPHWMVRVGLTLCLIGGLALVGGCGGDDKSKTVVGSQVGKTGGGRNVDFEAPPAKDAAKERWGDKDKAKAREGKPVLKRPSSESRADELPEAGLDVTKGSPATGLPGFATPGDKSKIRTHRLKALLPEHQTDKDQPAKLKAPQVWHRDAARKTLARVYVGDGNALELVSLHVSVVVEGPRARTLVDHVFRNPHDRQLEGTFEYPLPPGASPSYFAMFLGASRDSAPPRFKPAPANPNKKTLPPESLPPALLARAVDVADWGRLQEARVVAPERGAEAYEEVVRSRIDPALLEYASGNTFRGRVFPIAPRGYNRVILAYEETLPVSAGRLLYRFDLPGQKLHEMRFSLQFDPREAKDPLFRPAEARKEAGEDRTAFQHTWSDTTPKGHVLFSATPADPAVQATSGRHGDSGPLYLYARLRPELPKLEKEEPFSSQAVFLLDTSLSEQPDRFAVSMKLLKAILESDPSIKQFNVLAFNAAAAWVEPKGWLSNTKAGREQVLAALDGVLLEGATDLSAALEKVIAPDFPLGKSTPLSCFLLSDGHLTWGQTEVAPLVARFRQRCPRPVRFFCYRTGLGEENAELFDALTAGGGGTFQCFGEAEVAPAAKAHQRQCVNVDKVRLEGGPAVRELLVAGRRSAVYPGGELVLAGHFAKPGKTRVVLEGTFAGRKYEQSFNVEVHDGGELAARGWGEVAVASLLALNDPWLEGLVTAYCQQFNIANRAGSFLVLENEADYKRFDLDKEKGRTVKEDLGRYLQNSWAVLAQAPSLKQGVGRLLFQIDSRTGVLSGDSGRWVRNLLAQLSEEDCSLPAGEIKGAVLREKDASAAYLAGRQNDRAAVSTYLTECQRRHSDNDVDGAVRVLSSIVEEHPGRGDALRLVGYRLLDLRQPALAGQLFARVLRQRPYEPHSFRDLARSLEDSRRYPLAALLHEAVLAGKWHNRFGDALKTVTREDHVRLLRAGLREGKLTVPQRSLFQKRLEGLAGSEVAADLRVSISWNTDATDVDLHVIEPDGHKVFYSNPRSPSGGELSQDQTQGYGPERYHIRRARKGEYRILVHYFSANPNLLGGETHVNVVVTRHAGSDREKVERHTVILKRAGDQVDVCRIRY